MSYDHAHAYRTSSGTAPYAQQMNKFWVIQKDIHRKVITARIREYLGPEATVRSYTKDGEDGYLITTPGEFFTDTLPPFLPYRNHRELPMPVNPPFHLPVAPPPASILQDQVNDICNESNATWERQAVARFGNLSNQLKRPMHQPVVIYRAARPGASAYGYASGFAPYMAPSDYGPPPTPTPSSPFAPPPRVGDARAVRPGTPRHSGGSGRRSSGLHQHSRHHRSHSGGSPFSLPHAPPAGSSRRWEPSTMQEEGMDYEESHLV